MTAEGGTQKARQAAGRCGARDRVVERGRLALGHQSPDERLDVHLPSSPPGGRVAAAKVPPPKCLRAARANTNYMALSFVKAGV